MSASAPAGSASSITGRLSAASTSATSDGDDDSDVISQPAPTSCIQVPMLETIVAIHRLRKSAFCSGLHAVTARAARHQRGGGDGRGQVGVDLRAHGGAFADRAAHALDRARAHVADGEHAGHARLERRRHVRRRSRRAAPAPVSTKPCESSATPQPSSQSVSGIGADEQEHVADRVRAPRRRCAVAPASPPRGRRRRRRASRVSSVCGSSSMFGVASMRSIR